MAHDVFISHSTSDVAKADAACAALEASGVRCWIAPRDVRPGENYGESIYRAIEGSRLLVVILSAASNESDYVARALEKAVSLRLPIIPVRIEKVAPSAKLGFYLATLQWLEAWDPPPERYLERLVETVASLLAPTKRPPRVVTTGRRVNLLGNSLIPLPAGFIPPDQPPHVTIYSAATCVSNADYLRWVREGGPEPAWEPKYLRRRGWAFVDCPRELLDHPVVFVSQEQARGFCQWLTRRERTDWAADTDPAAVRGSPPEQLGEHEYYTLPTLAWWRCAAKASQLRDDAALNRSWGDGQPFPTAPVTHGKPNGIGLYGMLGGVFEWCRDEAGRKIHEGTQVVMRRCGATIGGGWASSREWLEKEIAKGAYGGLWCPGGWPMKDGGFRLWLVSDPDHHVE
jgi:hypothetical protein